MSWIPLFEETVVGGQSFTLVANGGSFSETGQAANLFFGRKISAAYGPIEETGQPVALLFGRKVEAALGSYSEGGQVVNLLFGRRVTADQGPYVVSGQSSGLLANRIIVSVQGSYSHSGQAANLLIGRTLVSGQGSFALAGQGGNLLFGRLVSLDGELYAESGQGVNLLAGKRLTAAFGSFVQTGKSVYFAVGETYSSALIEVSSGGNAIVYTAIGSEFAEMTFPANCYNENLYLRATSHSKEFFGQFTPPPGRDFSGKVYELKLYTSSDVLVTSTHELIQVVLHYDPGSDQEDSLAPYRWNGSSWLILSGYILNKANKTISFSTSQFSPVAIFGSAGKTKGRFWWLPKHYRSPYYAPKTSYPKRSKPASEFMETVTEKIMETGVVRNTHKPYNPRTNRRFKVPEHQAEVIAWKIAQREGLKAGRKPRK